MKNPFEYGSIVEGRAFCNRKQEMADLTRACESSEKLFVYSERRLGKTSLVHAVLRQLPKGEYAAAYVDLWPTDGEQSFVAATARAITESMSSTPAQMLETGKQLFSRMTPSISADADGKPKVTFGFNRSAQPGPEIEEVLAAPAKIAASGRKKVVMVFDEVQQVMEYGSDLVERRLRSIVQKQQNVAYIFLGSRKHLLRRMFLDRSRPLYRSAGHYPLNPIQTVHWLPFIGRKFRDGNKTILMDAIERICDLTQGHPFYTQHLCHAIWELCEPGKSVTENMIEAAVKVLLDRESYAYTTLWESLSPNQKRLLRGLAVESAGVKPFSGSFVEAYGLGSASNAQRAAQVLLDRDLIDRNGSFLISDRFFRIWIAQRQVP
jgi:hypothetical protein